MRQTFLARIAGLICLLAVIARSQAEQPSWEHAGWGGGGFYWAAAFDPSQDGVIYLAGDVGGAYKTTDHGKLWKPINSGLSSYGVFSLAVDRKNPQTVYAATLAGLCKSADGGEHWAELPNTGPKDLHITGERYRSVHCVAVDPTNSNNVYAGTPAGRIYKSTDGGQTWQQLYETGHANPKTLLVQFGKVDEEWFGVFALPLAIPANVQPDDPVGLSFQFQADGVAPRDAFVTLKTSDGGVYRSKNVHDWFEKTERQDVHLLADDMGFDPDFLKKHADKAATLPKTPDWRLVNQMAISVVGPPTQQSIVKMQSISLILSRPTTQPSTQPAGDAADPTRIVLRDFAEDGKGIQSFGNTRISGNKAGSVFSVAISESNPSMIVAATEDEGVLLSEDAGTTWKPLGTPKNVSTAVISSTDSNLIYAACSADGIWKSTDRGATWAKCSDGIDDKVAMLDIAISPTDPQNVVAIGNVRSTWVGHFYSSNDGGKTWAESSQLTPDSEFDPTKIDGTIAKTATVRMSLMSNLAMNPANPKELFIAGNWRAPWSSDGGVTWAERLKGADISCITDIRFKGNKAYTCAMDEGVFVGDQDGTNWRQLWPIGASPKLSGHYWQLAITENNGANRILSTCSPWDAKLPNCVVASDDSGETYKASQAGLPDYRPNVNVMWGISYPRALAVDPNDSKVVYLGIDGDAVSGKSGGGIFKSTDAGMTWAQLPHQPDSRRMFYGLAVDPTNSKRLFWGACATNGGLYRSEDGGDTWAKVFTGSTWIFNVKITSSGVIFCSGVTGVWRSNDHGQSWKRLAGNFGLKNYPPVIGLEIDPRTDKTIWISVGPTSEAVGGGVYKTIDGGNTWNDITGDLPYCKPMVLRFNPTTNELWAGHVGLYKIKQ